MKMTFTSAFSSDSVLRSSTSRIKKNNLEKIAMALQVTKITWKHQMLRSGKEKYCVTLKGKQLCLRVH